MSNAPGKQVLLLLKLVLIPLGDFKQQIITSARRLPRSRSLNRPVGGFSRPAALACLPSVGAGLLETRTVSRDRRARLPEPAAEPIHARKPATAIKHAIRRARRGPAQA